MYNDKEKTKKRKKSKKGRRFFFLPFKDSERVLSATEKKYFKILNGELLINLFLIILGIGLCFNNFESNIIMGILFILYGLVKLWAFILKNNIELFNLNIIYAIASIIIGIITMFVNTNIMLGVWLIFIALENIELALRLKKVEEKSWNYVLMTSILNIFIGILSIVNPFNNLNIYQVIGAFLILFGVLNSSKVFLLKNKSYNFV